MKREIEYRKLSSELRSDGGRHLSGYCVRFNEPSQYLGFYEVISPTAITEETLKKSDIYCLWNHNQDDVLGRSRFGEGNLTLTLDDKGLRYDLDLLDNQIGDMVLSYVQAGIVRGSSFAFTISDEEGADEWSTDEQGVKHRVINKIDMLFDCSPCFEPAYLSTEAPSCRSYEKYLESEKEKQSEIQDLCDEILNL